MLEHETESLTLENALAFVQFEIMKQGKPVFIISDIDDTLSNSYNFDSVLQTHIPNISNDIIKHTQKLRFPLLMATGRPSADPVVTSIWRLLSRPTVPIIVENGGVIFQPENNSIQILATPAELNELEILKHILPQIIPTILNIPSDNEIIIDTSRFTSVEIRIQDKRTKTGNFNTHDLTANMLQEFLNPMNLVSISSGSSVSIHSPNISKGIAILKLLPNLGLKRSDVTLLAIGDNHNDASLFSIADISVGVGTSAHGLANIVCPLGEKVSSRVLKLIGDCTV